MVLDMSGVSHSDSSTSPTVSKNYKRITMAWYVYLPSWRKVHIFVTESTTTSTKFATVLLNGAIKEPQLRLSYARSKCWTTNAIAELQMSVISGTVVTSDVCRNSNLASVIFLPLTQKHLHVSCWVRKIAKFSLPSTEQIFQHLRVDLGKYIRWAVLTTRVLLRMQFQILQRAHLRQKISRRSVDCLVLLYLRCAYTYWTLKQGVHIFILYISWVGCVLKLLWSTHLYISHSACSRYLWMQLQALQGVVWWKPRARPQMNQWFQWIQRLQYASLGQSPLLWASSWWCLWSAQRTGGTKNLNLKCPCQCLWSRKILIRDYLHRQVSIMAPTWESEKKWI